LLKRDLLEAKIAAMSRAVSPSSGRAYVWPACAGSREPCAPRSTGNLLASIRRAHRPNLSAAM
jgi:hypothetical protein